jgi:hypothetical protein
VLCLSAFTYKGKAVKVQDMSREMGVREAAEVLRLNPKCSREVHKERVPIKDPAMLERQIAALRQVELK